MGLYTCWLQHTGLSARPCYRMTREAGGGEEGARNLYEMPERDLQRIARDRTLEVLRKARNQEPEQIDEKIREEGISFTSFADGNFPARLKDIPNPPYGIFCRGSLPKDAPSCAIIGTRAASPYGIEMARMFAKGLSENGVQVVSGMARGIDGIAGREALRERGGSFAVLGSGVDVCYPREHEDLYRELCSKGGVLSEYPPGSMPDRGHFPARNRIIAGLSDIVLVVEAQEKSGTLITVDAALEQGKEIFSVPGRICDRNSYACNHLIRQGAVPATCLEDVLEYFFGLRDHQMDFADLLGCVDIEDLPGTRQSVRTETMRRAAMPLQGEAPDLDPADFSPLMSLALSRLDPVEGQGAEQLLQRINREERNPVSLKDLNRALTYLAIAGYAGELREGIYVRSC